MTFATVAKRLALELSLPVLIIKFVAIGDRTRPHACEANAIPLSNSKISGIYIATRLFFLSRSKNHRTFTSLRAISNSDPCFPNDFCNTTPCSLVHKIYILCRKKFQKIFVTSSLLALTKDKFLSVVIMSACSVISNILFKDNITPICFPRVLRDWSDVQ